LLTLLKLPGFLYIGNSAGEVFFDNFSETLAEFLSEFFVDPYKN